MSFSLFLSLCSSSQCRTVIGHMSLTSPPPLSSLRFSILVVLNPEPPSIPFPQVLLRDKEWTYWPMCNIVNNFILSFGPNPYPFLLKHKVGQLKLRGIPTSRPLQEVRYLIGCDLVEPLCWEFRSHTVSSANFSVLFPIRFSSRHLTTIPRPLKGLELIPVCLRTPWVPRSLSTKDVSSSLGTQDEGEGGSGSSRPSTPLGGETEVRPSTPLNIPRG